MLNLSNYKHHSEVEKVLIENGYSSYSYIPTGGSPTMRYLGAIRCDTIKYYYESKETETNSRRYKREPIGNELDDFD